MSATTMVERLINTAPTSGPRVMPAQANAPAASRMATTLSPAAQGEVLDHLAVARDGEADHGDDATGVVRGEHYVGRFDGHVGTRSDCDSYVRASEGGRGR